jgi:hypothetical protein
VPVEGRYVQFGRDEVGFEVEAYDRALPLVIDPVLTFSTYFGAGGGTYGNGIAVDGAGNIYVTGSTSSNGAAFVAKLNPATSQVIYTTYFGTQAVGRAITVDSAGQAYVGGYIYTGTLPLVNPLQSSGSAFLVKLNAAGSAPVFSTYLGGTGGAFVNAIVLDPNNNNYVFVGGQTGSSDLAVKDPYQASNAGGWDGFLAKIDCSKPAFVYSTYVGGSGADAVSGITVDPAGNLWVTGQTFSSDFPLVEPYLGPGSINSSSSAAFVAEVDATGSHLLFSTFLGTGPNQTCCASGNAIASDAAGNAYITGTATPSGNFLLSGEIQNNADVEPPSGCFVIKFTSAAAVAFSSLLSSTLPCTSLTLMKDGRIAITGATSYTGSIAFPLVDPVQASISNYGSGFVSVLANDGSAIEFSTYLGSMAAQTGLAAIAADANGNVYVTGYTSGPGYPLVAPVGSANNSTVVSRINLATSCTFQVSPTAFIGSASPYAQYGIVFVTAPAGCVWNATGPYVLGPVGPGGSNLPVYQSSGNDTVIFAFTYTGYADQYNDIVVAGQKVALDLKGFGCTYSLQPFQANISAQGGFSSLFVNTSIDCPYTATPTVGWITIDGVGNGSVSFAVAPNTGGSRQGAILIAGLVFTVNQDGVSGPATHFSVAAQSNATAGLPVTFTVTALDASNSVATFTSPVHFTSTDASATLPRDATLINGIGTFTASLVTPGTQTLTASTVSLSITGTSGGITVTAPSGLRFIPVTPCRVVDTRNPAGPFGGHYIVALTSRSFTIPNSACGIPATAQSYSFNVTVVPHGPLGFITVWPTGLARPLASTLNSPDGRIKANGAIVPAGTSGGISVFATNETDLVLDINGYFVPASNTSALAFYPMTPCRLVDTRINLLSSGALTGGASRTLPLLSSSCNVPATAQAYSLNFTVVLPGMLGYLSVWPTGQSQPLVSTLNDLTGTIVANAAIVPAGTAGSIDVYATSTTDLVVDINGYFAPPGAGGLSLYSLPPCRVLDTRNPPGSPPFTGSLDVNVIGSGCGGTSAAHSYVFNATVVPTIGLGYLTLWPHGAVQPTVSTLNAEDGAITSNMAIVPTNDTEISAYANTPNTAHLILDMSGYFAP